MRRAALLLVFTLLANHPAKAFDLPEVHYPD